MLNEIKVAAKQANWTRVRDLAHDVLLVDVSNKNAWSYLNKAEKKLHRAGLDFTPGFVCGNDERSWIESLLTQVETQDEAIRRDPNNAAEYLERGNAYSELRQYEWAIEDFDEAIRLNPRNAIAYGSRGVAYQEIENHQMAIESLENAIQLDSTMADVYHERGRLHSQLGNLELELADCEAAVHLDPHRVNHSDIRGLISAAKARL